MKLSLVLVILLWLQEPIVTSPVTSGGQFGGGGGLIDDVDVETFVYSAWIALKE